MYKYTFSPFAPNIFDTDPNRFDALSLRFILSNECEIFSSRVTFLLENYCIVDRMENRDAHTESIEIIERESFVHFAVNIDIIPD